MDFNDTQLEILYRAWVLARKGCGQVLEPFAYPDAVELQEAGWLERRMEDNGHASWWWSQQAEGALDTNALTASVEGRQN